MRRPRIHYPGATYHAMARGVDGREIFSDDDDRNLFLRTLTKLKGENDFSLLAYCLMGNRFHLAIKVRQIPLSTILQRLLTRYALTFNARHDRTGHLFQARYKAVLCVNERYLIRLIDYIHKNPVRSGWVPKAVGWRWSSAQAYAEGRRTQLVDPLALPAVIGLAMEPAADESFDPWQVTGEPALLRTPAAPSITMESLAESVSASLRIPVVDIKSRRRYPEFVHARKAFIAECLKNGRSLSEIGRWLNRTPAAVHYLASRGSTF